MKSNDAMQIVVKNVKKTLTVNAYIVAVIMLVKLGIQIYQFFDASVYQDSVTAAFDVVFISLIVSSLFGIAKLCDVLSEVLERQSTLK